MGGQDKEVSKKGKTKKDWLVAVPVRSTPLLPRITASTISDKPTFEW